MDKKEFEELQMKTKSLQDEQASLENLKKELWNNSNDLAKLLCDIISVSLNEDSYNPYSPMIQLLDGSRSFTFEDLNSENLNFFASIYECITNNALKARIADLFWYIKYQKNIEYPIFVIKTYLNLDISSAAFWNNFIFVNRGLYLAHQINEKELLQEFENKIFQIFSKVDIENTAYHLRLSELIRKYSIGESFFELICNKLLSCAIELENCRNYSLAEQYYDAASLWTKSKEQYCEIQIKRAKSFIHNTQESNNGAIANNVFYESALKIIRNLDKKIREKYFSIEEENELIKKIKESGKKCIQEMKIESFSLDISKEIDFVINSLQGKTKQQALQYFVQLGGFISYKEIEASTIKLMKTTPLSNLFGSILYSYDGRIISKTDGIGFTDNLSVSNVAVYKKMIWQYTLHIILIAQASILPGLEVIKKEHKIEISDMIHIVTKSNLIPSDRIFVFAKGLLSGFNYDYITAIHLLVPQIENLIRVQLQNADVKTSTITLEGIEDEVGLDTLVKKDEFTKIFGDDLSFEIKALLCEKTGPNLRNNLAHGLLPTYEMNSLYSIYFWWLCFKLVYLQFANTLRNETN